MSEGMKLRRLEMILALVGNGRYLERLHTDLHQNLQELEDFVNSEQKDAKLSLTLKLDFSLDRTMLLKLAANHSFKTPKLPVAQGIAWLDDGEVTPQNPQQLRFDLRETSGSRADTYGGDVIEGSRQIIEGGGADRRFAD